MHDNWLASRLMTLIPLWLSLSVHEWAHAWMAWRLGDDTAQRMGRLTLNPLAHIDPVGTLLLPLLGIPFGWAKPVPVQPQRFRPSVNMGTGMMLVAAAGPVANLGLALLCVLVEAVLLRMGSPAVASGQPLSMLLHMMLVLNVLLAMFNALPIPPLDGSRVVDGLMPAAGRGLWQAVCRMAPLLLAAVIILPAVSGHSLFRGPLLAVLRFSRQLVYWLAG
jgi:Zn-dependent protease